MKRGAGSDVYKPIRQALKKALALARNRREQRALLYGGQFTGPGGKQMISVGLIYMARKQVRQRLAAR